MKRKGSRLSNMGQRSDDKSISLDEALPGLNDEDEATDYVFRIISTFRPEDLSMYLTIV